MLKMRYTKMEGTLFCLRLQYSMVREGIHKRKYCKEQEMQKLLKSSYSGAAISIYKKVQRV